MAEIIYIIHKERLGKPKPMTKAKFQKSAAAIHKDGWRAATMTEIKKFYDLEEIKPKVEKKKVPKKEESKD